jgi:hypothetical protein
MTIDQFARSGMMGPTTNEFRNSVQFEGGSYDPALVSAFQKYRSNASAAPQPTQMGLGALAMRQDPQMDPGMMQMMQRLQGGMPQPAQQTGGMMPPGMAAPGEARISAMNFTPRPATMGLDGMPIQRANDPQMLAQMQAMQQQGGQGGMPQGGPQVRFGDVMTSDQDMRRQLQAMGLDGPRSFEQEMQYQQFMQQQPQMTPMGPMTPQQIASMTPAMRQQMTDMENQAETQRLMAERARLQQAFANQQQGGMMGGVPVQRPMQFDPRRLPVGVGGKGAGMDPRMMNPPRPGLPSTMTNNRRPMMQSQRTQAANPFFAQMMRGGSR